MNEEAMKELYDLIEVESDGFNSGGLLRQIALNNWANKWLETVESQVTVLSRKYLGLEHEGAIRYKLATEMSEKVAEDCAKYDITDKNIRARLTCIRRVPKKRTL